MLRSLRSLRPRLTYANVMSTIAVLAVLSTGVAVAHHAPNNTGRGALKTASVTTDKLATNAVTRAKVRRGAINRQKLAEPLRPRWAVFNGSNGNLIRGRGVVDVSRLSAGRYDVTLNRDPRQCAMFASLSPFTLDGRFIGVSVSDTGGPNDVRIQTRNSNGDLADVGSVQLLVVC